MKNYKQILEQMLSESKFKEFEEIIRDANRPKPGELVPLKRFRPDGKLLPPRQKPEPNEKIVPPSRRKEISSWMNQTPPTSGNIRRGPEGPEPLPADLNSRPRGEFTPPKFDRSYIIDKM